jgi:hypothetical protein
VEKFPLLDIVIGLSLIYTFLSLLTSELTRMLVRMLHWRQRQLQRTILNLLGESVQTDHPDCLKETITGRILSSPAIVSAIRTFRLSDKWYVLCGVSPQLFAQVLLEVLQSLPPSKQLARSVVVEPIAHLSSTIASSPELSAQLRFNLERMIYRIRQEPDPEKQFLQLQDEIAFWFSCALQEPSRTYRLHLKMVSFGVSLAVVVAANVDSLYIIRRISENTATRAVVMEQAVNIQGCQRQLGSPQCTERLSALMERTFIPVSWHPANRRRQFAQLSRLVILRTIGGWLLSSLAVAMGSRFWLQIFKQLGAVLGKKDKS